MFKGRPILRTTHTVLRSLKLSNFVEKRLQQRFSCEIFKFSCEICQSFKNTCFYRTPPVAALWLFWNDSNFLFVISSLGWSSKKLRKSNRVWYFSNIVSEFYFSFKKKSFSKWCFQYRSFYFQGSSLDEKECLHNWLLRKLFLQINFARCCRFSWFENINSLNLVWF